MLFEAFLTYILGFLSLAISFPGDRLVEPLVGWVRPIVCLLIRFLLALLQIDLMTACYLICMMRKKKTK